MADRTPSRMDRARAASEARDKRRKKSPDELSRALDPHSAPEVRRAYRNRPLDTCPDCGASTDFLRYDAARELWVHERCRGTWTQEELEYEAEKRGVDSSHE